MCYTAGPRCSPHALKTLVDAKETFNQVDPTDLEKMKEAKEALFVAEEEYLTSPAGIKKLREKAKTTGDAKYAVKADEYTLKRKEQIAVSKEIVAVQKEAASSALKKPSNKTTVEEDVATEESERKLVANADKTRQAQAERSAAVENYRAEKKKISDGYIAVERFHITESLLNTKINAEYDHDGTQCGPDDVCNAGNDYCRDSEYINLRVDPSSLDTRRTLSNIYGTYISNIPDDLEKIGRDELKLDDPESYDVEAEYGYYGVEGARVTLASPSHVRTRLNEYYESKYQELRKQEKELNANTPSNIKTLANRPAPAKPRTKRGSKTGASKPSVTPVKPQRRERTEAELDAFELDAMTPRPTRKATLPKAPVAPVKPRRRELTSAELDAYEADERN
jgi:hypothetical protein